MIFILLSQRGNYEYSRRRYLEAGGENSTTRGSLRARSLSSESSSRVFGTIARRAERLRNAEYVLRSYGELTREEEQEKRKREDRGSSSEISFVALRKEFRTRHYRHYRHYVTRSNCTLQLMIISFSTPRRHGQLARGEEPLHTDLQMRARASCLINALSAGDY